MEGEADGEQNRDEKIKDQVRSVKGVKGEQGRDAGKVREMEV